MKIIKYIKGCYDELAHKVVWPTFSQLQDSVIKVSVASIIMIFIVLLMDWFFNATMHLMFF